jgi:hypothetical protein
MMPQDAEMKGKDLMIARYRDEGQGKSECKICRDEQGKSECKTWGRQGNAAVRWEGNASLIARYGRAMQV